MTNPLANHGKPGSVGWQRQLREAVRDVDELERLLELPAGSLHVPGRPGSFPLLVPRAFIERMQRGDPYDPLLRQVLPTGAESFAAEGFSSDPIGEQPLADHGCIGKYPGRVLLITTGACPVHCRYCFRREFPYAAQTASRNGWQPALERIRQTPGVREIILSGGDPLSLGNDALRRLVGGIEALGTVSALRIHTRFPIVLPARVDSGLIRLLDESRLDIVIVVHANHPAEIDDSVAGAARSLRGVVNAILNQSVLLARINDDADTLIELGRRLVSAGILPYYLHALDRVSGTAHFEVSDRRAAALVAAMRRRAPGYLVPRLVRDIAGELGKTPLGFGP